MNMNHLTHEPLSNARPSLVTVCKATCKKMLARLQNIKAGLLNEFRQHTFAQEHQLQLALNEAEALAYETGFPLLTFPVLAREKIQAVATWRRQQNRVRLQSYELLAA